MIIHCALLSVLSISLSAGQSITSALSGGLGGQDQCPQAPQCFTQCQDTTLANAFPFVRQTPSTCEECMSMCSKLSTYESGPYICRSAVYDCKAKSCDLFAVRDAGSLYGMGRRKRGGNNGGGNGNGGNGCKGGQKCPQPKPPQKQPYPGRTLLIITAACPAGQFGATTVASTAAPGGGGASTYAGASTTTTAAGGGAETTTAAGGAETTTASPAKKKKMIKDTPMRRKDAVSGGACAVHIDANGHADCGNGIRFEGTRRVKCVPNTKECNAAKLKK